MSLGEAFQKSRERAGLSQRQLAERAGYSSSFVTRLERNLANPTWRAIEALAAALGSLARLTLVPDDDAVTSTGDLVSRKKPVDRLRAQRVNILAALSWLVQYNVPFVVTGPVAALVQGFPTPASELRILIHDTDEGLLGLQDVLLSHLLLFEELEVDELRPRVERSWPIGDCEVHVTLVEELPTFLTVELLDSLSIRVLPPDALLLDEEVAATLRISRMGSSES